MLHLKEVRRVRLGGVGLEQPGLRSVKEKNYDQGIIFGDGENGIFPTSLMNKHGRVINKPSKLKARRVPR